MPFISYMDELLFNFATFLPGSASREMSDAAHKLCYQNELEFFNMRIFEWNGVCYEAGEHDSERLRDF